MRSGWRAVNEVGVRIRRVAQGGSDARLQSTSDEGEGKATNGGGGVDDSGVRRSASCGGDGGGREGSNHNKSY